MAEAKRDQNSIPTILAVLNTDGTTPTNVRINPVGNLLKVDIDVPGSDFGSDLANRDQNVITTMIVTDVNNNIISLYVDSNGQLMVQST